MFTSAKSNWRLIYFSLLYQKNLRASYLDCHCVLFRSNPFHFISFHSILTFNCLLFSPDQSGFIRHFSSRQTNSQKIKELELLIRVHFISTRRSAPSSGHPKLFSSVVILSAAFLRARIKIVSSAGSSSSSRKNQIRVEKVKEIVSDLLLIQQMYFGYLYIDDIYENHNKLKLLCRVCISTPILSVCENFFHLHTKLFTEFKRGRVLIWK